MSLERVFLGWDRPCLPAAVGELATLFPFDESWDLSQVVIATSGARAGRRLLELLAQRSRDERRILLPPAFVTAGSLPEQLYPSTTPVADDLACLLAWVSVLRATDPADLAPMFAKLPDRESLIPWVPLARDMVALRNELAGEGLDCASVAAHCSGRAYDDSARWRALAALEERLATFDPPFRDIAEARRSALAGGTFLRGRTIVLVATSDLPKMTRRMLASSPARVIALIHAPETEADRFDDVGCTVPAKWRGYLAPLEAADVSVVDGPRDQAYTALAAVNAWNQTLSMTQMTVGVGDSSLSPVVARVLEMSGRNARTAAGRAVSLSRPATLLAALADYADSRTSASFASLLRHPDIERYLLRSLNVDRSAGQWLKALDRFRSNHLPPRLRDFWPRAAEDSQTVRDATRAIDTLLAPLAAAKRPLGEWSEPIVTMLAAVYAGMTFDTHVDADWRIKYDIEAVAAALKAQRDFGADKPFSVTVTAPDAIRLALNALSQAVTPEAYSGDALELLGWLELQLDDAKALAITGFNEGHIPESAVIDPLLPDSLRHELGLVDDERKYARDIYTLTAIIHSRPHLRVICGRRSASGDPLRPSRLLFACESGEMVRRAALFYDDDTAKRARVMLKHGETNTLATIPLPQPANPIRTAGVTWFRAYIACPYRFYLRYVLKREMLTDGNVEMDNSHFGLLAHETLKAFAGSNFTSSRSEPEIAEFLTASLDDVAQRQFGNERLPAVEIQLVQLKKRFEAFARFQAEHAAQGWRIERTEVEGSTTLDLGTDSLQVTGRVDRIDRNAITGDTMIVDYKLGDSFKSPAERHLSRGEWVDLQLPLYRRMAPSLQLDPERTELGYVCICKELDRVGFAPSKWELPHFEAADAKIDEVARGIVGQVFWPPRNIASFVDGYEGICLDRTIDRARVIDTLSMLAAGGRS